MQSEKNSQIRSTHYESSCLNYKLLRKNKLSSSLNFDIAINLTVWSMRRVIFSLLGDLKQASESNTTDRSSTASKSLRLNESGNCGNKRDCGKLRFILCLFIQARHLQFKTRLSLFEAKHDISKLKYSFVTSCNYEECWRHGTCLKLTQ